MPRTAQPLKIAALALIVISLLLYLVVVWAEQNKPATVQTTVATHVEGASGEGQEGSPAATSETAPHTDEALLGVNLESPLIVTVVVVLWGAVALGLLFPARWALIGGIVLGALFVPGDLFELANKLREANVVLIAAVVLVIVMHAGIIYCCWRALRSAGATNVVAARPAGSI
jgi:hypothetical protein